jgi:hypothetical protein
MNNNPVQEGMNAYYSRDPEALKRLLEKLVGIAHDMRQAASAASWVNNPDRSGGAYTEAEIRESKEWR